MSISFKKYSTLVSQEGDLTEEQLDELFGIFQNNQKVEKLKDQREKLKQDTAKKVADWRAKKAQASQEPDDEEEDDIKPGYRKSAPNASRPSAPNGRMNAAQGRAAERDWTSSMQEATKQKDFAKVTFKQVSDAMGGKAKILKDFAGKDPKVVADAMEKVCQKLQKEANAFETEAPEYHDFMDWADLYFNDK